MSEHMHTPMCTTHLSLKNVQCCMIHHRLNHRHLQISFPLLFLKCFKWFNRYAIRFTSFFDSLICRLRVNKSSIKVTKNTSSMQFISVALRKVISPTHPNYFAIQDDLSCFTFTVQWMESVILVVTRNWAHYWLQLFWMPTTPAADDFGSNSEKYLHKS